MPITLLFASILGLIFLYLSIGVVRQRARAAVSMGAAKDSMGRNDDPRGNPLLVAIRTHGNFAEYVPFCVLMMGLIETQGSHPWVLYALGATLVLARIMHPIGMAMKPPNVFRIGGVLLTWLVMLALSCVGLYAAVLPLVQ